MKPVDLGQEKVALKKMEEVKEAFDNEVSGATINEVKGSVAPLSTRQLKQAIKGAVEESVQDANAQDEV